MQSPVRRRTTMPTFNGNNTLAMVTDFMNGKSLVAQAGAWVEREDGQFIVTITGTPAETYAEPQVITFERQDAQIVAVVYDVTQWGEEGLTLTDVSGCSHRHQL